MKRKKIIIIITMLIFIAVLLTISVSAISESELKAQVEAKSKTEVGGNVFIWFLCAIAFLKISQKIDSFMSSLGINVGQIGGSLLGEIMLAAKGLSFMKNFGGGKSTASTTNGNAAGNGANTGYSPNGFAGAVGRKSPNIPSGGTSIPNGGSSSASGMSAPQNGSSVNVPNGTENQSRIVENTDNTLPYSPEPQNVNSPILPNNTENQTQITEVPENAANITFNADNEDIFKTTFDNGGMENISANTATNIENTDNISTSLQNTDTVSMPQNRTINAQNTQANINANKNGENMSSQLEANLKMGDISDKSTLSANFDSNGIPVSNAEHIQSVTSVSNPESVGNMSKNNDSIPTNTENTISAVTAKDTETVENTSKVSEIRNNNVGENISANTANIPSEMISSNTVNSGKMVETVNNAGNNGISPKNGETLSADTFVSYMGYADKPDVPTFKNLEIGGGMVTGTEITPKNPDGIKFGMYNSEQYKTPSGGYTRVKSVDGSEWYKQYAHNPETKYKNQNINNSNKFAVLQKLPEPPQRKDSVKNGK